MTRIATPYFQTASEMLMFKKLQQTLLLAAVEGVNKSLKVGFPPLKKDQKAIANSEGQYFIHHIDDWV